MKTKQERIRQTRHLYFRLNAGNDVNGNPRRMFVIVNTSGDIVETQDEGYNGDCVVKSYPNARFIGDFTTTPKEYRQLLKFKA